MRKTSCSLYRLTTPITTGAPLWACIARALCFHSHTWSDQRRSEIVLAPDASSEWRILVTQGSEFSSAQFCWALSFSGIFSVALLALFSTFSAVTDRRTTQVRHSRLVAYRLHVCPYNSNLRGPLERNTTHMPHVLISRSV